MQSVMKHRPAPLTPKRQLSGLDAHAFQAARDSMLAARGPDHVSEHSPTRQANATRISAERGRASGFGLRSKAASRALFSPASAAVDGYRKKHGSVVMSGA